MKFLNFLSLIFDSVFRSVSVSVSGFRIPCFSAAVFVIFCTQMGGHCAIVFPVVNDTRTKSIQKQVKSTDVDKVEVKNL